MQFTEPTDIERRLIPEALAGRDILGQARTGTGKTAAFGLAVLQQLNPAGRLQAVCLVPTRELAVQVAGELRRLAEFADLHVVPVYGGQKVAVQLHELGRKPHFVVGTPGRVLDFIRRKALNLEEVRFVVLDEVDRMLDIGFRDDITAFLGCVTGAHQTIFVSATLDDEVKRLARQFTTDPVEVDVSRDKLTVDEVDHWYVTADPHQKFDLLRRILKQEDPPITIIFCNTRAATRKLAKRLYVLRVNAKEIHGDLEQWKRDRVMEGFRKHQIKVLVATDLASRGIDVSAISHIINYDIPDDPHVYVHRIGRTARMGAKGVAITFVAPDEGKELTSIEMLINKEIPQRSIPGFEPLPAAVRSPEPVAAAPPARFQDPVFSSSGDAPRGMPSKTLGSRFRPARGRRRL
jgi:ATP-dependent RNA helicase DeaD